MSVPSFRSVLDFIKALALFIAQGGNFVDQSKANARAAICLQCHNNTATGEVKGGCGTCGKGVNYVINMARKGLIGSRKSLYDPKLKVCALCGCDIKVKVWFPQSAIGINEHNKNAFPSFCWLKDENK